LPFPKKKESVKRWGCEGRGEGVIPALGKPPRTDSAGSDRKEKKKRRRATRHGERRRQNLRKGGHLKKRGDHLKKKKKERGLAGTPRIQLVFQGKEFSTKKRRWQRVEEMGKRYKKEGW